VWSAEAVNDLESLADHISRDSIAYAASFIQEIPEAGKTPSKFSKRGRVVPELNDLSVRELLARTPGSGIYPPRNPRILRHQSKRLFLHRSA